MDKQQVNELLSGKLKLIRTEKGYTQDKMSEVLGMSKKTLVQIEKGRTLAGWTTVVALCALFRESEILQGCLGDDPVEMVETIAHNSISTPKEKTMGGRVWWREVESCHGVRLQQNVISGHFRILDKEDYRLFSGYDKEEAYREWQTACQSGENE
ncbi:helix-turn-helix transcriptional regulator [Bacillus sp. FJAT-42315]|uniref:helix-turn-helix transcriptional regulator n=2 Tax=Bacillus sp. FJAT-42315 TaxID=2014077 RepID=UPI000C248054|nr:helix-turn-helix transcriptional regulator [Bacillus sp. FJAT-42315]